MANITIYTGDALRTSEKIQAGHKDIIINKVYKSTTAKCLFYINNKGYLHILQAGRTLLNGKICGYHLTDHLLTNKNELQYKTNYTKEYKTVEELKEVILEMTA